MKNYYIFVAGKSGGHLLPCITKAREIYSKDPSIEIIFFTTTNVLDKKIISHYPFIKRIIFLPIQSISVRQWWKVPWYSVLTLFSFFRSFTCLWKIRSASVTSMGGFISLPVCFAAWLLKIPITIFELNVEPGKAVSFLAPLATHLYVCFEQTKRYFPDYSIQKIDYPIRFAVSSKMISAENARQRLQLSLDKKTIFILGGSQGSLFLNNLIKNWIVSNSALGHSIQIIHQIGTYETMQWQAWYDSLGITAVTFAYNEAIEYCYQAADLIVCRGGAGTLFEIKWFNKKCICIPLQTKSTAHQVENARIMQQLYPNSVTMLNQSEVQANGAQFDQALQSMLANH